MLSKHDLNQIRLLLDERLEIKLEEKLEIKLEEKLEEKLEIKLEKKLDEKLEQKIIEQLEPLEKRLTIKLKYIDDRFTQLDSRVDRLEMNLSAQIQALSDQAIEYVDILHADHEKRIKAIEDGARFIISGE